MKLRPILLLICLISFFTECKKDSIDNNNPLPNPVLPDPISTRLQGNVFDENGMPMIGATVTAGSQTALTDDRGYFRFQSVTLDKNATVVTAEKTGYFKGFRTLAATEGTNQVIIKMIPKTLAGTVSSSSGGTVTLTNGSTITFPANSIVKKSNNSPFNGTVNVYAAYIDPTAANISEIVPGSFMANDKNGNRVMLSSYGMMSVELESSSAEPLQIKAGSSATLAVTIPNSLLSTAPSTIPMWSVNETSGLWNEEGSAIRQGNFFVGNVSHFSSWNVDLPFPSAYVSVTLKNVNAAPLAYTWIKISTQSGNSMQSFCLTDSLGHARALVPVGSALLMEVTDRCGVTFFSQNIGPFSQNTNLGTITITSTTTTHVLTVTGRLVDCNNNPVTNGYARVHYGYMTNFASTDSMGNFSMNFITCNQATATLDVLGVDQAALLQASLSNVTVTTPTTNVGSITVCGTSSIQFLNYSISGRGTVHIGSNPQDFLFASTAGVTANYTSTIEGTSTNGDHIYFQYWQPVLAPGTYTMMATMITGLPQIPENGSVVALTSFATASGMYYEGSFFALFNQGADTLSGNFRIRR